MVALGGGLHLSIEEDEDERSETSGRCRCSLQTLKQFPSETTIRNPKNLSQQLGLAHFQHPKPKRISI